MALGLLGTLGAVSTLASGMPRAAALATATMACVGGVVMAWRQARAAPRQVSLDGAGLRVDGAAATLETVRWRGPLVVLVYRQDGRRERLLGWPDALDAGVRRELKLALPASRARQARPTMAP